MSKKKKAKKEITPEAARLLKEAAKAYQKAQEDAKLLPYESGFLGNNHGFTEEGTTE